MSDRPQHRPKGEASGTRPGEGPLVGAEPAHRSLEDPVLADRSNPRWDGGGPGPAQSLANPDGTPNVMPPRTVELPSLPADGLGRGTPQDQAARMAEPEVGRDNIRQGRGGGAANPTLAEGGDSG